MTVNDFFVQNINLIKAEIIDTLDTTFDSHEFIRKFSKRFEADYIRFLCDYSAEGAFREIHKQIAQSLSRNEAELDIAKTNVKDKSPNIFGEMTEAERWAKV